MAGRRPSGRGGPCSRAHGRDRSASCGNEQVPPDHGPPLAFVGRAARSRRVRLFRGDARINDVPGLTRQPSVTTDVVYGHKDGLALTFDVYRPDGRGGDDARGALETTEQELLRWCG